MARLFPWASDYLAVYERFGLNRPSAVMAHNVHPTDSELDRLAAERRCSGALPVRATPRLAADCFRCSGTSHAGVRCALGTDVGGGTGFGMLKEGLQAYLLQRIAPGWNDSGCRRICFIWRRWPEPRRLGSARRPEIFAQENPPTSCIFARPPIARSPRFWNASKVLEQSLAAIFTLAGAESVREVRVEGSVVYRSANLEEP